MRADLRREKGDIASDRPRVRVRRVGTCGWTSGRLAARGDGALGTGCVGARDHTIVMQR